MLGSNWKQRMFTWLPAVPAVALHQFGEHAFEGDAVEGLLG
jgi:hypothetical protein